MNVKYENRLVLFLDILGFKNLIDNSLQDKGIFNNIYQAIHEIYAYENKFGKIPSREVTTFSDSIVISYPIHNSVLKRIFHEIREIVLILLKYGFVCGGGIGIGELFHKDSIVFGPAMVEAYILESKHAKHPRVIVSNQDINKFNLNRPELDLTEDDDGYSYFDIFQFYYSESGQMMYTSQFIKDKLEEIIHANISDPDETVRNKYVWLSNKLNEGLKRKIYFVPVKENQTK